MKLYFSPQYAAAKHSFDTTRKSQWIADSLNIQAIPGVEIEAPHPLGISELTRVHHPAYVHAVRTGKPNALASSQGFSWDPGLWDMVTASNAGMVEAALEALHTGQHAGTLSSGLHHARYNSGSGFCTFNGLALAADAALQAGARNVLILDFDAHCGGGTTSLIKKNPRIWHGDVSVNSFDSYMPTTKRHRLMGVADAEDYLAYIIDTLDWAEDVHNNQARFDLVIYNAGMDPHEDCDTGGLDGIDTDMIADRESIVFGWARTNLRVPVAFTLAGGYSGRHLNPMQLTNLHRLTIAAAATGLAEVGLMPEAEYDSAAYEDAKPRPYEADFRTEDEEARDEEYAELFDQLDQEYRSNESAGRYCPNHSTSSQPYAFCECYDPWEDGPDYEAIDQRLAYEAAMARDPDPLPDAQWESDNEYALTSYAELDLS